jgi:hypothetical protein
MATPDKNSPESVLVMVGVHSTNAAFALEARDEAIMAARSKGATLQQIADATKMTPQGISKIIQRKATSR